MNGDIAVIICREVNLETGEIAKYVVHRQAVAEIKGDTIFYFKMRALYNPELRYFIVTVSGEISDISDDAIISCMETSPEKFIRL